MIERSVSATLVRGRAVPFVPLNLIFYNIRKILFQTYYFCTTDDDEETYLRESQTEPINNQKVHYVYLYLYSIVVFPLAFYSSCSWYLFKEKIICYIVSQTVVLSFHLSSYEMLLHVFFLFYQLQLSWFGNGVNVYCKFTLIPFNPSIFPVQKFIDYLCLGLPLSFSTKVYSNCFRRRRHLLAPAWIAGKRPFFKNNGLKGKVTVNDGNDSMICC